MKISKTIIACLCLLVLILTGCGEKDKAEVVAPKAEKVVPIAVEIVKAEDMVDRFVLPAGLEAEEDIVIAAETTGPVQSLRFEEGDRVKTGAVLMEIDPETIKSALRRDQENLAVIERKLERYKNLEKEGLVSRQDVDDLENSLVSAREAVKTTKLQFKKSQPRSPLTGHVDELYVDRGEYVDPGKPLVRLLKVDRLKVMADVPEKDIIYLSVGQKVKIIPARIHSEAVDPVIGQISFIAYAADDVTRTYRTKIMIDNPGNLRPGMIVRAEFIRQSLSGVITVPLYALLDDEGSKSVFVSDGNVARRVAVETGSSIGQRVVILSGLNADDHVVIKGQQLLHDGTRISEGAH